MSDQSQIQASEFKSYEILESLKDNQHLTDREKHLIGLAVTATARCPDCTGERIKAAVEDNVPYDTVVAALDLAAACNAGVTMRMAIEGSKAQGISKENCSDGVCTIGVKSSSQT